MTMTPYIRNAWYMAAWEEEILGNDVLPRTLLDQPWMLYRRGDGGYAMMLDRCPHRLARLSKGQRIDDTIACPYHGLEFGSDGACTRNPFSDVIPPHARVQTCATAARHGAVWFWPGDPDRADPALIPDFSALDRDQVCLREKTRFAANYEVITDNLLDLSHAEFIHVDSFRTQGKLFSGEHRVVESQDGAIWSNWTMRDTQPPEFVTTLPPGTRTDEWMDMRWHAPASMLLHIGVTPTGGPRDTSPVPEMVNPHIITPETATSSHYFYTRMPGDHSAALARMVFEGEDKPMLEDIQQTMGETDFWDWQPVILSVDAGGVRARRRLMKLRREEAGLEPA
jgi:phenylpropionate dioxygenase-like ring-hydroxylating dioxygenase large terminal subunit